MFAQSSTTGIMSGTTATNTTTVSPQSSTSKSLFTEYDTSINSNANNKPLGVRSVGNNNNHTTNSNSNNNTSSNTMLFSSTSTSSSNNTSTIPLQPTLQKQDTTSFNMELATRSAPSSNYRGIWTQPPTFFRTSSSTSSLSIDSPNNSQDIIDMEMDPITSETTDNVVFGEGKSLLRFSINPEAKATGRKRQSSLQNNERRVSFKRTSIDEGKGKARADDGTQDTNAVDSEEAESIYVFGFARNTEQKVLGHFSSYGKIVNHEKSTLGNWIVIRFATPTSAQKALDSNGISINGDTDIIGVTRGTNNKKSQQSAIETAQDKIRKNSSRVIPFEQAKDLYKKPESAKKSSATGPAVNDGLGSGKAGLSVLNVPTVNSATGGDIKLIKDVGLLSRVKDFFGNW
ncbi:hypothetical protein INT45_013506 [Circinella minor]|uniref:RRM Nup35-type domain-containing protein n=1 Tax=Circinella minor TaxID=1195481 RepID=A0A8H7S4G1_9FUNG|nr:hypothetical protein INT45_013506 [Circinella minor]